MKMEKSNWTIKRAWLFFFLMTVSYSFAQAPQHTRLLYENALSGNGDDDFATLTNNGGTFVNGGWKAKEESRLTMQLKNRLPAVGSIEISMTNFKPFEQVSDGKQTIFCATSRPYSRLSLFYEDTTSAYFYLRTGTNCFDGDKCNLEFDPAFQGVKSRTDYRDIFVPNIWKSDKTYQFKFVWNQDYIWVYLDGQMVKKLEFKGPIERFQHISIGGDEIYRTIPGPIYSNFKIYTAETAVQFDDKTFAKHATGLNVPKGGHGIAVADVNDDGLDDMYISNYLDGENLRDILYIQQPNHTFVDETGVRGINIDKGSYSSLFFDADNDGDLDLFCCRIDAGNRLYINNGDGNFSDAGALRGIASSAGRTSAAVAFDADNDGDMDLLAVNQNSKHAMYINTGDGFFALQDRGFKPGLGAEKNDDMPSVTVVDFDRDGDSDIYMNWPKAGNELYVNNGNGVFSEKAAQYNVAYGLGSQGALFADFDKDGDSDLFLTTKVEGFNSDSLYLNIYKNNGAGNFSNYTPVKRPAMNGYSQLLFDADNDGHLDVYCLQNNQFDRYRYAPRAYNFYRTSMAKLYLGDGAGGFTYSGDGGADIVGADARSSVANDFDSDGDLDLYVTTAKLENVFLQNSSKLKNNWLEVTVIGLKGDLGGIGSKIRLYNSGHLGDNAFLLASDEVVSQSGYLSSNNLRRHFGLGDLVACDIQVERVDGSVQTRRNVAVNQRLVLSPESAPVAEFSGTPTSGNKPLNVQFTNQSTGSITSYSWTFGDGGTGTDASPSHLYANAGTYTVNLTVTGTGGSNTKTRTDYITVTESTPVAEFTGTPTSGNKPLNVQFTNQSTGSITTYSWTFGDGGAGSEASPSHIYANAGTYTVNLTITGPGGSDTEAKSSYITVTESAPVAEFTGTPTSGNKPLNVQFTNQSTGSITTYAWTFGDGGVSNEAHPAHVYANTGTYTVNLTITGPGGSDTETKSSYITVTEAAPVAEFTGTPTSGNKPLNVQFTNQSTGSITAYSWNFGDGGTGSEASPSHVYANTGTYTVNLTVTGDGGTNTKTRTDYITVTESAPAAEFTGTPTSGNKPLNVQFTNQSTGSITTYSWTFGDGGTGNEANPAHVYANAGTYTVNLTVSGDGGTNTKTRTDYITVTESAPVAEFSGTPTSGNKPLNVQFTNQSTGSITSYSWIFGDGGVSSEASPLHSYTDTGIYSVALTVTGDGGTNTKIRTDYITVTEAAPVAEFSGTPTSGNKPLNVQFTNQSTGSITSYSWNFGDGGVSSEASPLHSYTDAGIYSVALTVTGDDGTNTKIRTDYITVTESEPVAEFSGTPTSGNKPLNVQFTNQSTGSITTYSWTFGDGGTSTDASPSHLYANTGTYTVNLTITGPGGSDTETKSSYITVTEAAPVAEFTGTPISGNKPLTVSFTDQSIGTISSRVWNFGDGALSIQQNPFYTYNSVGTYTVSLTVTGPGGSHTVTRKDYIVVHDPSTLVKLMNGGKPEDYLLMPNFPNPFNPSTNIQFQLPEMSNVQIIVFDAQGRKVEELINGSMQSGTYNILWDAKLLPSGTYIIYMKADHFQIYRKALLIK